MITGQLVQFLTDGHAIFAITTNNGLVTRVQKAPIHSFCEDDKSNRINWEELDIISCPKFNELVRAHVWHGRRYFIILHNQQLYFVHSQGEIFMSFIQPLIVPVIWGNSGVKFEHAPYFVGLPDGTMLMIGMIGKQESQLYEELDAELEVIKVSQRGNNLYSHIDQ